MNLIGLKIRLIYKINADIKPTLASDGYPTLQKMINPNAKLLRISTIGKYIA
jgi:hypothetical protein